VSAPAFRLVVGTTGHAATDFRISRARMQAFDLVDLVRSIQMAMPGTRASGPAVFSRTGRPFIGEPAHEPVGSVTYPTIVRSLRLGSPGIRPSDLADSCARMTLPRANGILPHRRQLAGD
jgi:hypothetical protein